MKATEAKLLSFLQKSPQLVNPVYQRTSDDVGGGPSALAIRPYVFGVVHQSCEQQMDDGKPA